MAKENLVSNGFGSTFDDGISVFNCRISGVVQIQLKEHRVYILFGSPAIGCPIRSY